MCISAGLVNTSSSGIFCFVGGKLTIYLQLWVIMESQKSNIVTQRVLMMSRKKRENERIRAARVVRPHKRWIPLQFFFFLFPELAGFPRMVIVTYIEIFIYIRVVYDPGALKIIRTWEKFKWRYVVWGENDICIFDFVVLNWCCSRSSPWLSGCGAGLHCALSLNSPPPPPNPRTPCPPCNLSITAAVYVQWCVKISLLVLCCRITLISGLMR